MPEQLRFFPVRSHIEYPKARPSADALGEVEGDDGQHYYVKTDANGTPTRASEWVSTQIAEMIGIAAPAPAIIKMSDGNLVFGSRKITGTGDDVATSFYLMQPTLGNAGESALIGLRRVLSTIYALDMFLFNDDRHFGNYLSHDDDGRRRLYAFDFSRSLFWMWPWAGFPSPGQNTRVYGRILWQNHGFDMEAASTTVRRLEAVDPSALEGFLNRMPAEWLSSDVKGQFLTWWSGAARSARAEELLKGFDDGTLL